MKNGYEEQIKEIMRAIKPKGFYKGYHQLEAVLIEGCENWEVDNNLGKSIYPKVAERLNCQAKNIERNIRTLLRGIDYKKLSEIVKQETDCMIKVKELIDILIIHIKYEVIKDGK